MPPLVARDFVEVLHGRSWNPGVVQTLFLLVYENSAASAVEQEREQSLCSCLEEKFQTPSPRPRLRKLFL